MKLQWIARLFILASALLVGSAACDSETTQIAPTATPTLRPNPPPVYVSPEPEGVGLAEPRFEALEGAQAYYGRLGGAVFRMEVPVALYLHGVRLGDTEARAEDPPFRTYLIRTGVAWASSSFSTTTLIPGRAAEETAALWDEFVSRFGRPTRTYIFGESMGGAGTLISAERYANRYDGVVAFCPYAGQPAIAAYMADFFVAGALAAGVTQAEFDETGDVGRIINERIIPALDDADAHRLFEDILIALTGGPRAFDRMGVRFEEHANWPRVSALVAAGIAHNADRTYAISGVTDVTSEEFNRRAVRISRDASRAAAFVEGNEISGRIEVPTLAVHVTGDFYVAFHNQRLIRRMVEDAGRGDLLVQLGVQGPRHCGFVQSEWERAFELLRGWVERGIKPEGEDVFAADLSQIGEAFTAAPRPSSPPADAVPGARERVTLSGTVTVDGAPLSGGTFWFEVFNDGLWHACSFEGVRPARGRYERIIVAEREVAGCGKPGAPVAALTIKEGQVLAVETAWPDSGAAAFNVDFSTSAAQPPAADFTRVFGTVLGADGVRLPPGTTIAAYAGQTLCGRTTVPPVVMQFDAPDKFALIVAGPRVRPGCDAGAELRFEVNDEPVAGTLTNRLDGQGYEIVLTAR
jgi:pimeloyl-ACP methyl ester carboxylesterase